MHGKSEGGVAQMLKSFVGNQKAAGPATAFWWKIGIIASPLIDWLLAAPHPLEKDDTDMPVTSAIFVFP